MSGKSKPKRRMRGLVGRKPKATEKPKDVTIVGQITTNVAQNMDGGVMLIVLALGDDQCVYSWEGDKRKWYLQG